MVPGHHPEWVEVWSGVVKGDVNPTWFVSYCDREGETIVSDRRTEDEAFIDVLFWDLPVVRRH